MNSPLPFSALHAITQGDVVGDNTMADNLSASKMEYLT